MIRDPYSYLLLVDKKTTIDAFLFPKNKKGLKAALCKAKKLLKYTDLEIYCGPELVWSHPEKKSCALPGTP